MQISRANNNLGNLDWRISTPHLSAHIHEPVNQQEHINTKVYREKMHLIISTAHVMVALEERVLVVNSSTNKPYNSFNLNILRSKGFLNQ